MSTLDEAPVAVDARRLDPRTGTETSVWVVVGAMAATVLAATGMWSHLLGVTTHLYDTAESSLAVSLASVAQVAATMAALIPAGRLIDRKGPEQAMRWGAAAAVAGSALAAASTRLDGLIGNAGLIVSVGLVSTATAAYQPVMQAVIPGLVHVSKTSSLIMIQFTAINSAQIVGPILGSSGFGGLGRTAHFTLNALFFLPLLAGGALLARHVRPPGATRTTIKQCLRTIVGTPFLRVSYLMAFSIGLMVEPAITLGPALGEELTNDPDSAGVLLTAFAVGSVLGGVRSKSLGSGLRTAAGSTVVAAIGFGGAAIAPTLPLSAAGFVVAGAGFLWMGSALVSAAFLEIERESRGQMMALWAISIFGGRMLATGGIAATSDLLSPMIALTLVAVTALAISAAMIRSHRRLAAP